MSGAWVRSGMLVGATQLIAELGGDPLDVCRLAGVDAGAFSDPDRPITMTSAVLFLSEASRACSCESFGLQLSLRRDLSGLGPLWLLMRSASTVGQLLYDLARYYVIYSRGALVDAHLEHGDLFLTYSLAAGLPADDRHFIELGLALLCNELNKHAARGWRPASVQLRHAPPAELTWHRRFFGTRLSFNQDRNAVRIDAGLLGRPLVGGDMRPRKAMSAVVERRQSELPELALVKVESAIRALLPFSRCTIGDIALAVSASTRTLQRRLTASGTTFQTMRDRVRADLALKYLQQSTLQLTQIADILGYSEPSAFTRSFRRWHGSSPRDARQEHRQGLDRPLDRPSGAR